MPTFRDALEATFNLEAIEVSFLQAVEGVQMVENMYISPAEDIFCSRHVFQLNTEESDTSRQESESIAHQGMLYTRSTNNTSDEWIALELPRPALGSLVLLTLLHGADLDQTIPESSSAHCLTVDKHLAQQRAPKEHQSSLDDLLSRTDIAPDGYFPDRFEVHVMVSENPLFVSELSYVSGEDGTPVTLSIELHPTLRRRISIPV